MFSEFIIACLFAADPMRTSSSFVNAMTDGVVLIPYEFYIILGLLFSMIATQEFVVPKSMPKIGDLFLVEKLKEELFLMRFLIIYNN